ncbi:hypothetical protein [Cognataquiflexum rubidum]|uniref:hypothetical protein n=1 Tax=Cognataquiflexum rubidum TaxID=2922273 RepID=UPI001F143AD5|nr:hypothetical protein [Cognataquiflexum rubidum]MCH6233723.1 hypothetical protein [Cognataquiflexum rubidum]
MKTRILKSFTLLMVLAGALAACSPSTKILGSWKSPDAETAGYSNLFVAALIGDNYVTKKTIEDDIDELLIQKGVQAISNLELVKPGLVFTEQNRDQVVQEIKKSGRDGIMTIAIIDQTNETRYVPGTTSYSPMYYGGGYGRFGGYYGMYGPTSYSPGYYATDKNFYIEINLYDLGTQALVWSAQSETTNPASIDKAAQEFAYVVVDKMIKDGIIVPKTKEKK